MAKTKETRAVGKQEIIVPAVKFKTVAFTIRGTEPLVMHQMSQKVRDAIRKAQELAGMTTGRKKREPRDFEADFEGSQHREQVHGWIGLPAMALKNAMVAACRAIGETMVKAKMAFKVKADGWSIFGTPLIKIAKGKPYMAIHPAPVANGNWDLRSRAMFDPGWEVVVRIEYDEGMITLEGVTNLLMRAGLQVGVLEGRQLSKMSCGMGWGGFEIIQKKGRKHEAA